MNGSKKYTGITIMILVVATLGSFLLVSSWSKPPGHSVSENSSSVVKNEDTEKLAPVPSKKIDEHLTINDTLRDANFCGKIYKVKQVFIDGVDVVQRVADLATNNLIPEDKGGKTIAERLCFNAMNTPVVAGVDSFVSTEPDDGGDRIYRIYGGLSVYVNPVKNQIFDINRFDGSAVGPIGTLK